MNGKLGFYRKKKSLMRLGKAQHCCFTWDIKVPFMCVLKRHLNYTKLSNYAKLHKLLTTQSGEPEGLLQGSRQEVSGDRRLCRKSLASQLRAQVPDAFSVYCDRSPVVSTGESFGVLSILTLGHPGALLKRHYHVLPER